MKTYKDLADGIAHHLKETMPMVADLPNEHLLASFILESLRYQLGNALVVEFSSPPDSETAAMDARVAECAAIAKRNAGGAMSTQVGGSHYKGMKIQHAEFCQVNNLLWCESAAIKYLCRHRSKNKLEDLKKAIHYVQLCAKLEYGVDL